MEPRFSTACEIEACRSVGSVMDACTFSNFLTTRLDDAEPLIPYG